MFFVYVDWTLEELPRCFYVGKGLLSRVNQHKRNKKHTNVANKHGFRREIVLVTSLESIALEHEKELILEFRTFESMSTIACNFTLGGEGKSGAKGRTWSTEQRNEQSKKLTGVKRSDTTKKKKSMQMLANNHRLGTKHSSETLAKMRGAKLGKKASSSARKHMSEARKGKSPWNKGLKKKEGNENVDRS